MNTLESLKTYTNVVADTGNLDDIKRLKPEEATTNPTLIWKAIEADPSQQIFQEAYMWLSQAHHPVSTQSIFETCLILMAKKILEIIPGRVSVEVESQYSFDTRATVDAALGLVHNAETMGINPKRLLIKIASTWEGIQAAKILEAQGIACNCTLIFNSIQALACAQANVTLISPFVGRIYDWYKVKSLFNETMEDPGVTSVKQIFTLLKSQGYPTEIMGASFRNLNEILALAGCDRLTIAPKFLNQMLEMDTAVIRQLKTPTLTAKQPLIQEAQFRWQMNEDPMATEKLAEGIRLFANDAQRLKQRIASFLETK